jgi:uncharacterized membrane protein
MSIALFFGWIGRSLFAQDAAPADEGYVVRLFQNSKTISQAIAINNSGDIVGTRELAEPTGMKQVPFFKPSNGDSIDLPKLEGYSNLEAEGVSDNGLVIGYASRPIGAAGGSTTAFVWDSRIRVISDLGKLPGDVNAHAQDISADGTRVTGYSLGADPARLRPCVWEYSEKKKSWEVKALPTSDPLNPFLQTGRVVISPNGKLIAACPTVKHLSAFMVDSSLMLWEQVGEEWKGKTIHEEQPKLKDINNNGDMVGSVLVEGKNRACVISKKGHFELIDLLPGDDSSVAMGINDLGIIVGTSDDENGGDRGPLAFILKNKKLAFLSLGPDVVNSSAHGINASGMMTGYLVRDLGEDSPAVAFIAKKSED